MLTNTYPSCGLNAVPPQLPPPIVPLNTTVTPSAPYDVYGPSLYMCSRSHHSVQNLFDSGVTVVMSAFVMPRRDHGAGFVGNGCVGELASPGTLLSGTFRSSTG